MNWKEFLKVKKNKMGSYDILITMTNEGANIWERITANNIDRSIAIVLDNTVYSYPVVRAKISEGKSVISGNFTIEQAEDLATILKFHSLPVGLSISDCKVTEEVK